MLLSSTHPTAREAAATALVPLARRLPGVTLLVTVHDYEQDVLHVVAAVDGAELGAAPGATVPLESAHCAFMAADLSPRLCNDAPRHPVYGACAPRIRVGSYLGVPLELSDGTRVGSVCAMSGERHRFEPLDEAALANAARALARRLHDEAGYGAADLRAEARRTTRPRSTLGRLRRPAPFLAALLLGFLTIPAPPAHPTHVVPLIAAVTIFAAAVASLLVVRWERLPAVVRMAPAYAMLVAVTQLRATEGGTQSGLSVLVLLPVLWIALHGDRRELVLAVAGVALALLLPPALVGSPDYPPVEWRRGVLTTAVSLLLGLAVQDVVELARDRATALRARARQVNASEESKRLILATAGEGILGLDADMRVSFANPAAASLTGHPPEALTGRSLADLFVDPDRMTREGTMRRADGTTFPVERVIRPLRREGRLAGAVVTFSDVTQRHQAERALDDERVFLSAVLASLSDGVVACGPDGRLRLFNEASRRLHGVHEESLAPEEWASHYALFRADGRTLLEPEEVPLARAFAGEVVRGAEMVVRRSDGEPVTLLTSGQPFFDGEGRKLGAVVAMHDVTERRHAERLKEEFFALVSHELRTPLSSIVGYLEVLREEDGEDDVFAPHHRRFLGVVERNARRLQRLVGDLLFVAQLEGGHLALEPGPVDLARLAAESLETARPRAREGGIELSLELSPSTPSCTGDAERLAQVLDNLVSNAVKFTPAGGRVLVVVGQDADSAPRVEVRDTGVGVPADELANLFQRFSRATTATERQIPGIGLGLAISKAIVEAHGGAIAVASEVDAGTTFTVRLPVQGSAAPAAEAA